jgi:subtilisin family serine protease
MKLIAPVKMTKNSAKSPTIDGNAWGIDAVAAHLSPYTGRGVTVAVLDTGIELTHPAFANMNIETKNFTSEVDADVDGHGTHCAGTLFGQNVAGVRIGVAPGIDKALIGKVLGKRGGSSIEIAEAIKWAVDNGAHVVSMSLGIDFPGRVLALENRGYPKELAVSEALNDYRLNLDLFGKLTAYINAQSAFLQPTLLVAAAGNSSQRDANPNYTIAAEPPAVVAGIVSVAAIDSTSGGYEVASFSNIGAKVAAPGVDILSAALGGGLIQYSGTSMATPHVAGVAALWAEKMIASGALHGQLLRERLVGTATTEGMVAGFELADVGAGLPLAPN